MSQFALSGIQFTNYVLRIAVLLELGLTTVFNTLTREQRKKVDIVIQSIVIYILCRTTRTAVSEVRHIRRVAQEIPKHRPPFTLKGKLQLIGVKEQERNG